MITLTLKDYEIASLIDSSFIPHAKGKVLKNICRLLFKPNGCYKNNGTISAETGTNSPNLIKWLVDQDLVSREMIMKKDGSFQRVLRYGKVLLELLGLSEDEKVKGGSPEVKHNSNFNNNKNYIYPDPISDEVSAEKVEHYEVIQLQNTKAVTSAFDYLKTQISHSMRMVVGDQRNALFNFSRAFRDELIERGEVIHPMEFAQDIARWIDGAEINADRRIWRKSLKNLLDQRMYKTDYEYDSHKRGGKTFNEWAVSSTQNNECNPVRLLYELDLSNVDDHLCNSEKEYVIKHGDF